MENASALTPFLRRSIAVQMCNLVSNHHPVRDINQYVPGWKIAWTSGQTTDPNYAFVAVNSTEDTYVLAFRGSVTTQNGYSDLDVFVNWVLEDMNIGLAFWPYAKSKKAPCVSAGVYVAFTSILLSKNGLGTGETLLDFLLNKTTDKNKQLIITGHSLGGNMANVYASYYVEILREQGRYLSNLNLYTFAAPAAGNADFADDLDDKISNAFHYQNNRDVVPHFPTAGGVLAVSQFYSPNTPQASAITVTVNGQDKKLSQVYVDLAGILLLFGYQQPKRNYETFTADLDQLYTDNTKEDWNKQVAAQHQISVYADYLQVKLPVGEVKAAVAAAVV